MSDLIKRLREESLTKSRQAFDCQLCGISANLVDEAADELDRLRRELAKARELLKEWAHISQPKIWERTCAFLTPSPPAEAPKCNCDDHNPWYCVNRASRWFRCVCMCHR